MQKYAENLAKFCLVTSSKRKPDPTEERINMALEMQNIVLQDNARLKKEKNGRFDPKCDDLDTGYHIAKFVN